MRRRRRAVLLATLLLIGMTGCDGGTGSNGAQASSRSPFRSLGKRADADLGPALPAPGH